MDANVNSLKTPPNLDCKPVDLAVSVTDEEAAQIPSIPARSQPSRTNQELKRICYEMESNPEVVAASATKKQIMNSLKSFKKLLFENEKVREPDLRI